MAVTYQRENDLSVDDYVTILANTTMVEKRPLNNHARIRAMIDGANFIVTARDANGKLLGLARCMTDFSWICYCAELAVSESAQGLGIGRRLIEKAVELLGPKVGFTLIAYPEAVGFYEHMKMEHVSDAFYLPRTDKS